MGAIASTDCNLPEFDVNIGRKYYVTFLHKYRTDIFNLLARIERMPGVAISNIKTMNDIVEIRQYILERGIEMNYITSSKYSELDGETTSTDAIHPVYVFELTIVHTSDGDDKSLGAMLSTIAIVDHSHFKYGESRNRLAMCEMTVSGTATASSSSSSSKRKPKRIRNIPVVANSREKKKERKQQPSNRKANYRPFVERSTNSNHDDDINDRCTPSIVPPVRIAKTFAKPTAKASGMTPPVSITRVRLNHEQNDVDEDELMPLFDKGTLFTNNISANQNIGNAKGSVYISETNIDFDDASSLFSAINTTDIDTSSIESHRLNMGANSSLSSPFHDPVRENE